MPGSDRKGRSACNPAKSSISVGLEFAFGLRTCRRSPTNLSCCSRKSVRNILRVKWRRGIQVGAELVSLLVQPIQNRQREAEAAPINLRNEVVVEFRGVLK